MPAAFLHGVETFDYLAGPQPIRQVKSAVIGIIGTFPIHHVAGATALSSTPVLVLSDTDRAKLGPDLPGYSGPKALKGIADQGAGTIIVINMFDPTNAAHYTDVAVSTKTIAADKRVVLPHQDLISVTVTTSADAACAVDTDYTVDKVTGIITVTSTGNLSAAANCKVAYRRGNPAGVLAADIVGSVSGGGVRLGMQAFLNCANLFGFKPKILIAPGYSSTPSVATAMQVICQPLKLRAHALVDVPVGTTRAQAVGGRAIGGAVNLLIADQRVHYCYPQVKVGGVLEPFSARLAGVIARVDNDLGYWWSPSNKTIIGVEATELPLTSELNDPDSDVNLLNAAGILTVSSGYGTGLRTWGNRSSAYPADTTILSFTSVRRTIDLIDEAIEAATLAHTDGPITDVLVTAVLEDIGEFLRTLMSRRALYAGAKVEFLKEKNPPAQLAAGQIVFTKTLVPPPPAERITHETVVDTTQLRIGT